MTSEPGKTRTVVILGASNVTLAWPQITRLLQEGFSEKLHLLVGHGMGRSYGASSRFLWRDLPGLVQCGLWSELDRLAEAGSPVSALVTDIGNDLMFGQPIPTITNWVETALARLQSVKADVVLTRPPLHSIGRTGPVKFRVFRRLFYANSPVRFEDMKALTDELDESVCGLATRFSASIVAPRDKWYGLDPIHLKRRYRRPGFQQFLSYWNAWNRDLPGTGVQIVSRIRPQHRIRRGRVEEFEQPTQVSARVTVSVY